ncbi:MAG TPA: ATP synthase F1 subunit delta [Planctomycetota bacterium]|jgi:ATP synthase F1 delta subunit|nr:ATP synthase F1 subunit delta [Planctomycetota bacterium]
MRGSGRLVRRYARALFEAAREAGSVPEVARDLERLGAALAAGPFLDSLLDPVADRSAKKRALAERVSLETPLVRRFVELLLDRRREEVFPLLAGAFALEADRAAGVVRGLVVAARAVPEEDIRALEQVLGASLGSTVRLAVEIDPELVGGIRIDVAGRRLDATVPGRLAALREELLAAPLA